MAEVVETGADEEEVSAEETELLPEPAEAAEIETWRGEIRTAALAAASGLVVGVATVAAAKAVGVAARHRLNQPRQPRLGRPRGTVATRTYVVDVHLLAPGRNASR